MHDSGGTSEFVLFQNGMVYRHFAGITYMPQITEYDGKFHRLSVKVNRPDTRVQSRSGYFALPANQDSLFTYEFPLLRALSLSPPPGDLSYYTGAVRLGQQGGKTRYSLVIEVPVTSAVAFQFNGVKYTSDGFVNPNVQVGFFDRTSPSADGGLKQSARAL